MVAGAEGRENQVTAAHGYGVCFGNNENVVELIVVTATQFCEYIKNH